MSNFEDMNVEAQLQVAYSTNAQLRDQIDVLNKTIWSLEERLRISDEGKEELKKFYENQMDILRVEHQKSIDAAVSRITKSFEEQIAKLIEERDAALLSAKSWRGKIFGRKSERNAGKGKDDDDNGSGEGNRESEKADYVDAETQKEKDGKRRPAAEKSTMDAERLVKKLKRRCPGADVTVERVDYSKASRYMSDEHVVVHKLDDYFTLSEGEYFRTGKDGGIEKSWYRIIIRHPERYEEHLYEAAHVRSNVEEEYKTTDRLESGRPVPGCMFGTEMLSYVLCEKYLYNTPLDQIVQKLSHCGLKMSSSVLGEHVHAAIDWMSSKLEEYWRAEVRRSWILMLDETRVLVGCKDDRSGERSYRNRYMWGIRANSVNLAWFLYEDGSRGAEVIRPFLDGFLGFYTTDGYVVYKIFDSKDTAEEERSSEKKGRRSACLVHIRRNFVDAIPENEGESMWFVDEFGRMFAIEHYCATRGLTGDARLLERLKPGNTADIMKRIEERLDVYQKSNFAGCGEPLKKALKYAIGEWPAMRRVLESGDVELSNNLSEQMMRRIKMNLKNAGNIGSERSARHNAFMYSVIESCKMVKRNVEGYLKLLLGRLRKARSGDDLTCCLPCYLAP